MRTKYKLTVKIEDWTQGKDIEDFVLYEVVYDLSTDKINEILQEVRDTEDISDVIDTCWLLTLVYGSVPEICKQGGEGDVDLDYSIDYVSEYPEFVVACAIIKSAWESSGIYHMICYGVDAFSDEQVNTTTITNNTDCFSLECSPID